MKHPQKSDNASGARRPKLSARPRQYVDVNDLRLMLKLGLGLHTVGDPISRLEKAMNGLTRLASADAWLAMVVEIGRRGEARVLRVFAGGKDEQGAQAARERIGAEVLRAETSVGRLLSAPGGTPGRVLAVIDERSGGGPGEVYSVLQSEERERGRPRLTWISVHRLAGAPFEERERRMLELFHSQSAWLLLRIAE